MRCPKCNYISFDTPERCRNCGYDFSLLSQPAPPVDLPMRSGDQPIGPAPDLPLSSSRRGGSDGAGARRDVSAEPTPGGVELPLFHEVVPGVDDTPLITSAPPPRPPLAVRRSSDTPRPRTAATVTAARDATPRLEFTPEPATFEVRDASVAVPALDPRRRQEPADLELPPPLARRIAAGAFDTVLMSLIDLLVLYFTLRLTALDVSQAAQLPLLPLLGFFALLNGGYLVGFTTASGQTIGQMLAGVRVVGAHDERVPLGQAVGRTVALAISLLPFGLGLLPMFLADDGRALHDRLSGTTVRRT